MTAAQSLLKTASDLAPSRFATESGSVEGKRVGVSWQWTMAIVAGVSTFLRLSTAQNGTLPRTHLIVGVTCTDFGVECWE